LAEERLESKAESTGHPVNLAEPIYQEGVSICIPQVCRPGATGQPHSPAVEGHMYLLVHWPLTRSDVRVSRDEPVGKNEGSELGAGCAPSPDYNPFERYRHERYGKAR
jgi:hypothetical protein